MKPLRPTLLLLSLLLSSACLPTQAQTQPTSSTVCLTEAQARIIDADLRRYPIVLKENKKLRKTVQGYQVGAVKDSIALTAKDSAILATERRVYFEGLLRKDAENRATAFKLKAHKRTWVIVALSALLLGITTLAVTH